MSAAGTNLSKKATVDATPAIVATIAAELAKPTNKAKVVQPATKKPGVMFSAADRVVRVRAAIDSLRAKDVSIVRTEGTRGIWTGETGGNESAVAWLAAEAKKGTAIVVKGSKFSIDLGLAPAESNGHAANGSKPATKELEGIAAKWK